MSLIALFCIFVCLFIIFTRGKSIVGFWAVTFALNKNSIIIIIIIIIIVYVLFAKYN
jgi:hypothetical protein